MKYLIIACCLCCQLASAQKIQFENAVFKTGDNAQWADGNFNDRDWSPIALQTYWEKQGYDKYDGYAWYRMHFNLPSALRKKATIKGLLEIFFPGIDDADITYLNGTEIGRTGRMADHPNGYKSGGRIKERHYTISSSSPALHWDQENVIAIRVYDGSGTGGIFGDQHFLRFWEPVDYIKMEVYNSTFTLAGQTASKEMEFTNSHSDNLNGVLETTVKWKDSLIKKIRQPLQLKPGKTPITIRDLPVREGATVGYVFTETLKNQSLQATQEIPYQLTPREKTSPQINNAKTFGCKPNVPFLFTIAATGLRPMNFRVTGLPEGLALDAKKGIITGRVEKAGNYPVRISATNKFGKAESVIALLIGNDHVITTPPMGWNSWNCWGLSVSDKKVKSSADAMRHSGLANHGWNYINIDDGWEAPQRAENGNILANEKFPDMKGLGDYLHGNGQQFGIYSSPGATTCGGYTGSYQKELEDARTYGAWGVDYLKYDLCSYRKLFPEGLSLAQLQAPYQVMNEALKSSGRNVIYSLCEYGQQDVWKWGPQVGGHVWRTTGDITDTWNSLKTIGFSQEVPASYNGPDYGFGDPDMLIVGFVGWGDNLHLTKLTPSEQYTHISLWSLLSAPLMLGCDLARMDPFTYNLLSNDEVIAIDQDIAGKGPKKTELVGDVQVWVKELADGSKAVGIFNLGDKMLDREVNFSEFGLTGQYKIRDLWRQKNLAQSNAVKAEIPVHGVLLLKLTR